MSPQPARLRLAPRATTLDVEAGVVVSLPVGVLGLADDILRSDPPTAVELERAIDVVEDALMGPGRAFGGPVALVTAEPLLRMLPGLETPGATLTREAVEVLFQRLASRSLGTPIASTLLPQGRDLAAALLVLRECMHHLGLERVTALAD